MPINGVTETLPLRSGHQQSTDHRARICTRRCYNPRLWPAEASEEKETIHMKNEEASDCSG
jgi:hypothetical protein